MLRQKTYRLIQLTRGFMKEYTIIERGEITPMGATLIVENNGEQVEFTVPMHATIGMRLGDTLRVHDDGTAEVIPK